MRMPVALSLSLSDDAPFAFAVCIASTKYINILTDEAGFVKWPKKKEKDSLKDNIKTLGIAVVIAIGFRSFLFEPFNIPSGSMIPTLLVGDYLFVSKYSYGYSRYSFPFGAVPFDDRIMAGEPERGDVVVFRLPSNVSVDYIKRVVGLPGDKIQLKDGSFYVNDNLVPRRFWQENGISWLP